MSPTPPDADLPRRVAEAFSGHRFAEAYPALADDVRWEIVGEETLVGPQAVIEACEHTLAALGDGSAESVRFVVLVDGPRAPSPPATSTSSPASG